MLLRLLTQVRLYKPDGAPASEEVSAERPDGASGARSDAGEAELLFEPVPSSTRTSASGDYWEHDAEKGELVRVHKTPRAALFVPTASPHLPIPVRL